MDSREIYERITNKYFSKIKYVRAQWEFSKESESVFPRNDIVCSIDSEDYSMCEFVMKRCYEITHQMIFTIIEELLIKYQPEIKVLYYLSNGKFITSNDCKEQRLFDTIKGLAFIAREDNLEYLYYIKEFGINNRIDSSKIPFPIKYISLVYKDAYREVINHNNDNNDPSRGTNTYSIEWFFEYFITVEEYEAFKSYIGCYTEKVKDYIGVNIIRSLKPNSLFNFKKEIVNELSSFDFVESESILSNQQISILKKHLKEEANYYSLLGNCPFAQSFQTAEWLYQSLKGSDNIDLTAILMGYFKSVEQFLFSYISMHTREKDSKTRKILKRGELTDLTDFVINQYGNEISLNSLTKFFGEVKNGSLRRRNDDLLYNDIDLDVYHLIVDSMVAIVGLRNSHFHKENISDWAQVEKERAKIYKMFLLFFSSYSIEDKSAMGIIRVEYNDYYKLCEYIHSKSFHEIMPFKIPVYYINDERVIWDCLPDDNIEYDVLGNPMYSGIYFKAKKISGIINTCREFHMDCLPQLIKEGYIIISPQNLSFQFQEPKKIIFQDGIFFA